MDWQFGSGSESDDIIAVVRTAYRGAVSSSSSSALCLFFAPPT